MKHGLKPTKRQKLAMAGAKLNPDDWLVTKVYPHALCLEHRHSGKEKILRLGRVG